VSERVREGLSGGVHDRVRVWVCVCVGVLRMILIFCNILKSQHQQAWLVCNKICYWTRDGVFTGSV
jgi:hypothetical protein